MVSKEFLGYLSILGVLISYAFYFDSIFKGKTKPHAFSWITWSILTCMAFYAQYSNEAGPGAWGTGVVAFACIGVTVLSFYRGEKDIRISDWIMFSSALTIIPVWYFTNSPLLAVILIILIDACGGYYPTFRKSWHKPHEEMLLMYAIGIPQLVFTLLAMEKYYLVNILYPLFIMVANTLFVLLVLWRRKSYEGKQS